MRFRMFISQTLIIFKRKKVNLVNRPYFWSAKWPINRSTMIITPFWPTNHIKHGWMTNNRYLFTDFNWKFGFKLTNSILGNMMSVCQILGNTMRVGQLSFYPPPPIIGASDHQMIKLKFIEHNIPRPFWSLHSK